MYIYQNDEKGFQIDSNLFSFFSLPKGIYPRKNVFYNTHSLNTKLNLKVKVMAVTIAK